MALGKPSKKTQNTANEAPAKTKPAIAGTKAKAPQAKAETAQMKTESDAAATKARRKPAAEKAEGTQVSAANPGTESPKVMAAAANSEHTSSEHAGTEVPFAVDLTAHPKGANGISREAIAQRAYHYWAERGFAHGYAEEDWARAEADLVGK